ncbi:hypothetical protein [Sphingobacterium sp. CZ-2]|uniref:hypothetical protein n=1 Tax=Sphingobacterium sp. CZ-2 TaxID=2557994 RepID=UPI0014319DDE|nr:hypothetical protein [Sphingobacterium sp. CZ-2]
MEILTYFFLKVLEWSIPNRSWKTEYILKKVLEQLQVKSMYSANTEQTPEFDPVNKGN